MKKKLPEKTSNLDIIKKYNLPVHDQKGKNNCTSHAFAADIEFQLSKLFDEQVLVDVDDLWEKQKKYGTATEEYGDTNQDTIKIICEYGVLFKTESGKKGLYKPQKGIEWL